MIICRFASALSSEICVALAVCPDWSVFPEHKLPFPGFGLRITVVLIVVLELMCFDSPQFNLCLLIYFFVFYLYQYVLLDVIHIKYNSCCYGKHLLL